MSILNLQRPAALTTVSNATARKTALTVSQRITRPASPNTEPIEGWLYSGNCDQSFVAKSKHFFVLSNDSLLKCKSDAQADRDQPEAVLWTMHFQEVVSTKTDSHFSFWLQTTGDTDWSMAALDLASKKKWLSALRNAIPKQPNQAYVTFDGHLWKKSGRRNVWKHKYFALYDDRRFVSMKRETGGERAKRFDFSLSDRSVVLEDDKPDKGTPPTTFTFSVTSFPGSGKVVYLATPDDASRQEWVKAINTSINLFLEHERAQQKKEKTKLQTSHLRQKTQLLLQKAAIKEQVNQERAKLGEEAILMRREISQERAKLEHEKKTMMEEFEQQKKRLMEEKAKWRADFETELAEMKGQLLEVQAQKDAETQALSKLMEQQKQELIDSKENEIHRLEEERQQKIAEMEKSQLIELEKQKMELAAEMKQLSEEELRHKTRELETARQLEIERVKQEIEGQAKADKASLHKQLQELQQAKAELEKMLRSKKEDYIDVISSRGRVCKLEHVTKSLISQLLIETPSGQYKPKEPEEEEDESDEADDDDYYDDYPLPLNSDGPAQVADVDNCLQMASHFAAELRKVLDLAGTKEEGGSAEEGEEALIKSQSQVLRVGSDVTRFNVTMKNDIFLPHTSALQSLRVRKIDMHTTIYLTPPLEPETEAVLSSSSPPHRTRLSHYAALNKVGYDAYKTKYNQDRAMVVLNHGNWVHKAFFAVFDGHGYLGHEVSEFVIKSLPPLLVKHRVGLGDESVENTITSAIVECDEALEAKMDVVISGTTAIIVFLDGDTLYTANVGDSRAVLGVTGEDGNIKSVELSEDQNPDSPVEKERIEASGGRVGRSTDYNGVEHGVSRVFIQGMDTPGLAMGRSMGDSLAHSVGVINTPVVTSRVLDSNCTFCIVASDGIWEFISSQEAVEIVAKAEGPDEACRALVDKATSLWNEHEPTTTDDITCVVIYFDTRGLA